MSLCLSCKHGFNCPYMEGVEDFIHIMVDTRDECHNRLMAMIEEYNLHIEKKYRFRGPLAGHGLEVGLEISHCEGFEDKTGDKPSAKQSSKAGKKKAAGK